VDKGVSIIFAVQAAFVWLGGALFVASLASFAFVYGIVLGRPAPVNAASTGVAVAVNLLMFTVFAVHHSAMARTGAKAWIADVIPPPLERSVYVWISSALFLGVTWMWVPVPGVAWELSGGWQWLGRVAQLWGLWLTARAAGLLDPLALAGIRQLHGPLRPSEFKAVGPFLLVRHPIYLGWILMVFGAPVMTMSRLVMAVVSSAYLVLAVPWEERSLIEAFGDRYRAYQQRVRWRIVPLLW
jgi:protein-S-isoprenylcysteine O-methyltransferase Ste14